MANNADQPKKNWWKGLKAEWKKIIWPSKSTLTKQTAAVIVVSVLLGIIITIIDIIAKYGIEILVK